MEYDGTYLNILFIDGYEYYITSDMEYQNFKNSGILINKFAKPICSYFLQFISNYKLIIDSLRKCKDDCTNPNVNVNISLSTLKEKLSKIDIIISNILINEILLNMEINNYSNIRSYLANILDDYITSINSIKSYLDFYCELETFNLKALEKRQRININSFALQIVELLPTDFPSHKKILCIVDKAKYIPSIAIDFKNIKYLNLKYKNFYNCSSFEINSINEYFNIFINYILDNKIIINKCKNCNKYFIPKSKINETLCDNIFINGKTCKELSYEIKLEQNAFSSLYRKAYKKQHAKKQANSHIPNIDTRFKNWCKHAKKKQNECASVDEFSTWLSKNENWYLRKDFD